jgi:hypothetical protein
MDYFDPSGDGTRIDYNAFCRLFRYKEPEGLPQVQRLVRTQHGCLSYTMRQIALEGKESLDEEFHSFYYTQLCY